MKFWSSINKGLTPYIPGEQPQDKKYIKLNTNENPYPPSPRVLEAIKSETSADVRLYPDPNAIQLKETLAEYYKTSADCVFVGNGSDEVLAFCFPAFFDPTDTVSFPEITYSFYPIYADLFRISYKTIPMEKDFSFKPGNFPDGMKGILLANPNAPTGIAIGLEAIEELLQRLPDTLVIVDEAYVDFGAQSAISLVDRYDNLLVIHTFSKSRSMAGLRVGYAIGNSSLIEGLNRVMNSFNSYTLDRIAQKAAIAAIQDWEYTRRICDKVIKTRESVREELTSMGFRVLPSSTNFLFICHEDYAGRELFLELKKGGILVRHFQQPGIENWLRVSIGTDDEMGFFIEKLKTLVV